jgi:hypothetical protein
MQAVWQYAISATAEDSGSRFGSTELCDEQSNGNQLALPSTTKQHWVTQNSRTHLDVYAAYPILAWSVFRWN